MSPPARGHLIGGMLQRHTGMRIPPGYLVYGLDTYHQIWCGQVERLFAPMSLRRTYGQVLHKLAEALEQ